MSIYRDEISSLDPSINPDRPLNEIVLAWNPTVEWTHEHESDCAKDIYPTPVIYVPFYLIRQYCSYRALMDGLNQKEENSLVNELINRYNGNKNS